MEASRPGDVVGILFRHPRVAHRPYADRAEPNECCREAQSGSCPTSTPPFSSVLRKVGVVGRSTG